MREVLDPARPMRADARRNRARILQAASELFASEAAEVQMAGWRWSQNARAS
ncbi:MAG TPA: hypothetical protein VNZ01_04525 [Solirubrobacteraceae bacterium]|jgi:hypothetical protein|nr:hypothetical protein [Solirubrobacteraceae bacterium]